MEKSKLRVSVRNLSGDYREVDIRVFAGNMLLINQKFDSLEKAESVFELSLNKGKHIFFISSERGFGSLVKEIDLRKDTYEGFLNFENEDDPVKNKSAFNFKIKPALK